MGKILTKVICEGETIVRFYQHEISCQVDNTFTRTVHNDLTGQDEKRKESSNWIVSMDKRQITLLGCEKVIPRQEEGRPKLTEEELKPYFALAITGAGDGCNLQVSFKDGEKAIEVYRMLRMWKYEFDEFTKQHTNKNVEDEEKKKQPKEYDFSKKAKEETKS